ncbi:hypothetical protein Bca101_059706 [Brassica carinata]
MKLFVSRWLVSGAFQPDSGLSDRFPVSGAAPFLWWSAGFASGILTLLSGDGHPAFVSVSCFFGVEVLHWDSPGFISVNGSCGFSFQLTLLQFLCLTLWLSFLVEGSFIFMLSPIIKDDRIVCRKVDS